VTGRGRAFSYGVADAHCLVAPTHHFCRAGSCVAGPGPGGGCPAKTPSSSSSLHTPSLVRAAMPVNTHTHCVRTPLPHTTTQRLMVCGLWRRATLRFSLRTVLDLPRPPIPFRAIPTMTPSCACAHRRLHAAAHGTVPLTCTQAFLPFTFLLWTLGTVQTNASGGTFMAPLPYYNLTVHLCHLPRLLLAGFATATPPPGDLLAFLPAYATHTRGLRAAQHWFPPPDQVTSCTDMAVVYSATAWTDGAVAGHYPICYVGHRAAGYFWRPQARMTLALPNYCAQHYAGLDTATTPLLPTRRQARVACRRLLAPS